MASKLYGRRPPPDPFYTPIDGTSRFNRTVIPLSEITECLATRASFGRYLGVGVRLGRDGSMAYTTSFGPALEVRRRSGRPFVVSSNRPEELRHILIGQRAR